MDRDDDRFVEQVNDPESREKAIGRWSRARSWSFIGFGGLFLTAMGALMGEQAALCGILSGMGAVSFAITVSTDLKIKIARLADESERTRASS